MSDDSPEQRAAKQRQNYHLSLAGEFYVAAELQRHQIQASVTYGNAKQTDVVAFAASGTRAVVVEVKTTAQSGWIVGGHVPEPAIKPWVFVYLPSDHSQPPQFFVLSQSELHNILLPDDTRYRESYRQRHDGKEFAGPGVVTLKRSDAQQHVDRWDKIIDLVNAA